MPPPQTHLTEADRTTIARPVGPASFVETGTSTAPLAQLTPLPLEAVERTKVVHETFAIPNPVSPFREIAVLAFSDSPVALIELHGRSGNSRIPHVRVAVFDLNEGKGEFATARAAAAAQKAIRRAGEEPGEHNLLAALLDSKTRGPLSVVGMELQDLHLSPTEDCPLNLSGVHFFGIDGCTFDGSSTESGTSLHLCGATIAGISRTKFERVSFRNSPMINVHTGDGESEIVFFECGLANTALNPLGEDGIHANVAIEWCDLRGADVSGFRKSERSSIKSVVSQFTGCLVDSTTKLPRTGSTAANEAIRRRWPDAADATKTDPLETLVKLRQSPVLVRDGDGYRLPFGIRNDGLSTPSILASTGRISGPGIGEWIDGEVYPLIATNLPRLPRPRV